MLAAHPTHHVVTVECGIERIGGDVGDRAGQRSGVAGQFIACVDVVVEMPAAEGSLVDEPQLIAVIECRAHPQMRVVGCADTGDQHLPAHAEVDDEREPVDAVGRRDVEPQILSASASSENRCAPEPSDQIGRIADVSADGPRV